MYTRGMSSEQLSEMVFNSYQTTKDELDFVMLMGKEFNLPLIESEVIFHLCKKIESCMRDEE